MRNLVRVSPLLSFHSLVYGHSRVFAGVLPFQSAASLPSSHGHVSYREYLSFLPFRLPTLMNFNLFSIFEEIYSKKIIDSRSYSISILKLVFHPPSIDYNLLNSLVDHVEVHFAQLPRRFAPIVVATHFSSQQFSYTYYPS